MVKSQLSELGLTPQVVDGSGLSRSDRTTPRQVVHLLEAMHGQEVAGAFEGSLAVAGRTGTIRRRMRGTAAQDRCRAKTGTLIGVSALAGLCESAGGDTIAFAMLMNRMSLDPRPRRAGPRRGGHRPLRRRREGPVGVEDVRRALLVVAPVGAPHLDEAVTLVEALRARVVWKAESRRPCGRSRLATASSALPIPRPVSPGST